MSKRSAAEAAVADGENAEHKKKRIKLSKPLFKRKVEQLKAVRVLKAENAKLKEENKECKRRLDIANNYVFCLEDEIAELKSKLNGGDKSPEYKPTSPSYIPGGGESPEYKGMSPRHIPDDDLAPGNLEHAIASGYMDSDAAAAAGGGVKVEDDLEADFDREVAAAESRLR